MVFGEFTSEQSSLLAIKFSNAMYKSMSLDVDEFPLFGVAMEIFESEKIIV